MAIALQQMYEDVAQTLGSGYGNDRLASAFPRAVNRALDELSIISDAASKFPAVASVNDSASIDSHYEYVLYSGVVYWLVRMGHRPTDPKLAALVYADSERDWARAKGEYVMDVDNINQFTDSTRNMIALGSVVDQDT